MFSPCPLGRRPSRLALAIFFCTVLMAALAPLRAMAGGPPDDSDGIEIPHTLRQLYFAPTPTLAVYSIWWVVEFAARPGSTGYRVELVSKKFNGDHEQTDSIHPENEHVDSVVASYAGPTEKYEASPGTHWVGIFSFGASIISPNAAEQAFQRYFVSVRVFALGAECALKTTIKAPTEDVPVGDEFTVEVGVGADSGGSEPVQGVDWTPLLVAPPELVELVSGPTPPDVPKNFTLQPGNGLTRSYVLRALAPGALVLSSTAEGACASGTSVAAPSAQRTVDLTLDVLDIKVALDPKVVDLEEDENGQPIFEDVHATVTITNIYDQPLDDVRIIDLRTPPREVPPPLPTPLAFVAGPFDPAGPSPEPLKLGTLAPGQTVIRKYDLRAQAQGVVDVTAYVSAGLPGAAGRVTESGKKAIEIKDDLLFVLDTHVENVGYRGATPLVLGGNSWRVVGTMENRSKEKTLLVQLSPELLGNASYGQPIPEGQSAPDAQCAVGILRELEPEEVVTFRAPVRTSTVGGTRGTVTYRPKVWVRGEGATRTLIHDERATPALRDDRVVVTDGSGKHTVSVDTSEELPRQPFADELIGHFLVGTADGLGTVAEGIWGLVEMAGRATLVILSPWEWDEALSQTIDVLGEYLSVAFDNLSEIDRETFFAEMRAGLKGAIDGTEAVYDSLIGSFRTKITDLTVAWETGDTAEVAYFWGELAGENPDVALGFAYGACKLAAKGARYAQRGVTGFKASQAATLEARIAAGVRALKPWDELSFQDLSRLYAIDARSNAAFAKFSAKGFVLGVRRRGQRAIAKLRSGEFLPKPYHLKAKNVSDIDVDWLGFPGDRLDEVLIKEPPPWPEVRDRMRSLGQEPDTIAEVRLRWEQRGKEWWGKGHDDLGAGGSFTPQDCERAQWLQHKENGIPYSKNSVEGLVDNFDKGYAIPPDDLEQVLKKFDTQDVVGSDGRGALAAKIDDKFVTGDVDPLYVGRPDGRGFKDLTDEERLEVYRLFKELGLQHPESRTWKNGKVREYFEEFSIHNPNGEAMAMYLPDGRVVAAFFDPGKSWISSVNWREFYMYFRGGTSMLRSANPDIAGLAAALQEDIRVAQQPRAVYVGPSTWALVPDGCSRARAGETCSATVDFVAAPDAPVLRQNGFGKFERWTAYDGWQPYVPPDPSLQITPQTYLADAAPAGSTEIQVGNQPAANAGQAWFAVGQTIVINPGGETQELATITGFGSLILAAPLAHFHEPSETIAVVGAAQLVQPVEHLLSGQLLSVSQKPGRPETRRARIVSRDGAQLEIGSAADVEALQRAGGWLRIRTETGATMVHPLQASNLKPLSKKKLAKGLKYSDGTVTKLVVQARKQVALSAKGAGVDVALEQRPGTVHVEIALGDRRFCFAFGGKEQFKAGKKLVRRKAGRPVACGG